MTTEKYMTLYILFIVIPAFIFLFLGFLPERMQRHLELHQAILCYDDCL